jgi:hypothetical protein
MLVRPWAAAVFFYTGNAFTNNGSVMSGLSFGSANFQPINQQLGGTGSFTGTGQMYILPQSTTTLFSDLTFAGSSIYNEGRINTGAFTLTLPCPTGSAGPGDIIGNVRRTNLGACTGPMGFGSPFTTIQFTSGTPPTEITVNTGLFAPAGFPNAVMRTYQITPTGGIGYTANLRLHPQLRRQFEQACLTNPVRRERVKFAETLIAKVHQEEIRQPFFKPRRVSFWSTLFGQNSVSKLTPGLAVAGLLLLVCLVWLFTEFRRVRRELPPG